MNKLYTARELAEILNCNPQTIYRLADQGEIEDFRVGGLRRFLMPEAKGQNNAKDRRQGQDNDSSR